MRKMLVIDATVSVKYIGRKAAHHRIPLAGVITSRSQQCQQKQITSRASKLLAGTMRQWGLKRRLGESWSRLCLTRKNSLVR